MHTHTYIYIHLHILSVIQEFGPHMQRGGCALTLSVRYSIFYVFSVYKSVCVYTFLYAVLQSKGVFKKQAHISMYMHKYINTYIHTHHTYIHTYIHTIHAYMHK
jgi:hypothetical protein